MRSNGVVSKSEFARLMGVSRPCVAQWLKKRQIAGAAIVGGGAHARIRVAVAKRQLKRRLDPEQHIYNGKAKLDSVPIENTYGVPSENTDTVEAIKAARLAQIELSNAKAALEAQVRSGRYVKADDARQDMGRLAAQLMAVFESSLTEFAQAIVAEPPKTTRDALRSLRAVWRKVRERAARTMKFVPATIEDTDADDRQ